MQPPCCYFKLGYSLQRITVSKYFIFLKSFLPHIIVWPCLCGISVEPPHKFVLHVDGVRLRLWTAATNGPFAYPSCDMSMESHGGILTGENRRARRKTCPSATLFTENPRGLTRARTCISAERGRWLTARATIRPHKLIRPPRLD
jgi:hypothetical protein